jgi:hypothetical protein
VAQVNDLSRSLTAFDPLSTLVVVVEMSKASWLVSGAVPGVERQPLKKLEPMLWGERRGQCHHRRSSESTEHQGTYRPGIGALYSHELSPT